MAVGLQGRQVKDGAALVHFGNFNSFGEDLVQDQQGRLKVMADPFHLGEGNKLEAVFFQNRQPAVVDGTETGIGDHRFILHGKQTVGDKAVLGEGFDDPFQLPGLGRAGGKVFGPGQVQFQDQILLRVQVFPVAGQFHHPPVVFQYPLGAGKYRCHYRFFHNITIFQI